MKGERRLLNPSGWMFQEGIAHGKSDFFLDSKKQNGMYSFVHFSSTLRYSETSDLRLYDLSSSINFS
jgi:hypothetical protein